MKTQTPMRMPTSIRLGALIGPASQKAELATQDARATVTRAEISALFASDLGYARIDARATDMTHSKDTAMTTAQTLLAKAHANRRAALAHLRDRMDNIFAEAAQTPRPALNCATPARMPQRAVPPVYDRAA